MGVADAAAAAARRLSFEPRASAAVMPGIASSSAAAPRAARSSLANGGSGDRNEEPVEQLTERHAVARALVVDEELHQAADRELELVVRQLGRRLVGVVHPRVRRVCEAVDVAEVCLDEARVAARTDTPPPPPPPPSSAWCAS